MESSARAVWQGGLKEGSGIFSLSSGIISEAPYRFATRFEGAEGSNPEELVAAAHASCFSMAVSAELGRSKITPKSIETSATVVLQMIADKPTVTESKLDTKVTAPGANKDAIEKALAAAKENCPISRLLNTKISLVSSVVV